MSIPSRHLVFFVAVVLFELATALGAAASSFQYAGTLAPEADFATGSGSVLVTIDLDAVTMRVEASFAGLSGTTTAAHIHCCTAVPNGGTVGVATQTPSFVGFPLGVTSGSFDNTFDMTLSGSFNTTFLNASGGTPATALSTLLAGLDAGRAYFNIHTSLFPGGEIRAFLAPVPEPGTALLLGGGLALLARRGRQGR